MHFLTRIQRPVAIALLATTTLVSLAPAAEAGRRKYRRYKGDACSAPVVVHRSPRVVVRESGAGPVLAGVLGGIVLGTVIAHAQPTTVVRERVVVREARYRYHDPYCDTWYDDLDECRLAYREHRHPRRIRVIEVRSGDHIETLRYHRGDWERCDDDWDEDWDD
jgi:hypothetical protein